ncbi:MAG: type II toxin-antitoxin system VapC family toxin [Chloroflexota bacterium]
MVYLDTSVAVALFVPEVKTASVKEWFISCTEPIVSSDWIVPEFASALSLKERRGELATQSARALWSEFESFRGTGLRLVSVSREAFGVAARMTRESAGGLRAGDSLHLAVALELRASCLATVDTVLEAIARRQGLTTIGF